MRVNTTGMQRVDVLMALYTHAARYLENQEPPHMRDSGGLFSRAYRLNADCIAAGEIIDERELTSVSYNVAPNYSFYEPVFMGYLPINLRVNLDNPNEFEAVNFDNQFGGQGAAERALSALRLEVARLQAAATLLNGTQVSEEEPEIKEIFKKKSGPLTSAFQTFANSSGSSFRNLLSLSPIALLSRPSTTSTPASPSSPLSLTPALDLESTMPVTAKSPMNSFRAGLKKLNISAG